MEYTIDNAVRDITQVSVAPASKGAVREILEKLLDGMVNVEELRTLIKPINPPETDFEKGIHFVFRKMEELQTKSNGG